MRVMLESIMTPITNGPRDPDSSGEFDRGAHKTGIPTGLFNEYTEVLDIARRSLVVRA
jgi:hypothetical protein